MLDWLMTIDVSEDAPQQSARLYISRRDQNYKIFGFVCFGMDEAFHPDKVGL